jgi:hypothetical protein
LFSVAGIDSKRRLAVLRKGEDMEHDVAISFGDGVTEPRVLNVSEAETKNMIRVVVFDDVRIMDDYFSATVTVDGVVPEQVVPVSQSGRKIVLDIRLATEREQAEQ